MPAPAGFFLFKSSPQGELSYTRTKRTSPHHLPKSLCLEGLAPLWRETHVTK